MRFNPNSAVGLRLHALVLGLVSTAGIFCFLTQSPSARANVYATNIRLNGGITNVPVAAGGSNVTISYILNEPASAGVVINIKSGAALVRTITLAGGGPGTGLGLNSVVWNGKDNSSNSIAGGTYSISITANADGQEDWWQTTDDFDPERFYYVNAPRGIAVNRNTNSVYYGRVFVGNSLTGLSQAAGDKIGFQKLNADGTPVAEGVFSTGGWGWTGNASSPWKIEVSDDDYAYVNDLRTNGLVLRFDQLISTNSRTLALRSDNWPNGSARLSGPFLTGAGTNAQIWMADTNTSSGTGIRRWTISPDGTLATNDLGTTIIQAGGGSDLNLYPFDVALDGQGRIYTIQSRTSSGDPAYRVFRFPGTNTPPETIADWKIGNGDDNMRNASGIAVNPAGTLVAVAFGRVGASFGAVRIFSVTNGLEVAALTLNHDPMDVAWDNVGNLYLCDNLAHSWRVYSPPGTNSATTVGLVTVQVTTPTAPVLSAPSYSSGQFQFTLTGQSNVIYVIQASTNLQNWVSVSTNSQTPAVRTILLPSATDYRFYRAFAQ